ncbi:MAG: glycoside hydrolase family 3 C-terminal domain-containing protein [Terriglobia bacterium]|jgi:beta-glucosidase
MLGILVLFIASALLSVASAQNPKQAAEQAVKGPWLDKTLSPDQRADLLIEQMSLDEKITLVHGVEGAQAQQHSLGGAGYVPGVPRLGIPALQMTDGRSGVANIGSRGVYATALPCALANAASWDLDGSYEYGAQLGKEVRDIGFNVSLGGTANIIREPRNGRNFECLGEDPLLIGKMLGRELKGTQDQQVIGNINRYAVNDQETGRFIGSAIIDKRAMQETDLLAFEIAIKESNVGTVMCAYNRLNSVYACESPYLLSDVLKKTWDYKGWVMTDWGAAHSAAPSALAGMDQEMPTGRYFGDPLKAAVKKGEVPVSRLDDMVHRILRTEFEFGVIDNPPVPKPVNPFGGADVAQRVEERAIVLLKNHDAQLPLDASGVKSIAAIGAHADIAVLSGAGSDQVDAAGGNAVPGNRRFVWHPSSPLRALRAQAPNAQVTYDSGTDPAAAAKLAGASDVAIVFVWQHTSEGRDVANLSLPDNQDELVNQVAAANPHTIVVLETGGPVTMPWLDRVSAVLEAWYPGIRGGEAVARVLFGDVNPSAKLPVTFPKSEADLPHAHIAGMLPAPAGGEPAQQKTPFDINYTEGLKVGYKWFEAEGKEPLFPFGFGLSYTAFSYSSLEVTPGAQIGVRFTVTNTGSRPGTEIAQVYATLPSSAGEPFKRLVGWEMVSLAAGESKAVSLTLEPKYLSIFNVDKENWELTRGEYKISVGGSSKSTPLNQAVTIADSR